MAFDIFTDVLSLGVQLTLALVGMLFLVSLGRDLQNTFRGHE